MSFSYSVYEWEDDNGEGIAVYAEGESLGEVYTSYDCPEDNSVRRLGIGHLVRSIIETTGYTVVNYDVDPEADS